MGGAVSLALDYASSGGDMSWEQAAGSFAGGAVTGAMVANGVPLVVANSLGSAAGEAVTQVANAASGKDVSGGKFVVAAAVGAIAGAAPKTVMKGITSGRGNMEATFKGQMTKLGNGTINNISGKTVAKGIASGVVGGAGQQATKTVIDKGLGEKTAEKLDNRKPATCLPANPHC